jgi:cyclopropane-fatty-acyl-phospholipid synthase
MLLENKCGKKARELEKAFYMKLLKHMFTDGCTVRFWDGEEVSFGSGINSFRIIINKPPGISEVITNPSVALGEAYMHKEIEIEGNIRDVIACLYDNPESFLRYKGWLGRIARPLKNTIRRSRDNAGYHYDIGNDFYSLWLDKTMTYSCGYFMSEEDTLDKAQLNKMDYILRKLNLKEGISLLDIGCGWGELIIRAAKKYKVRAIGITLSGEQAEKTRQRIANVGLEGQVKVVLMDYRQIRSRTFDRIVSVGMIEHVGKNCLGEYFDTVNKLLKEGGISLLHCITSLNGGTNRWIDKYIFPGGYVPSVAELVAGITGGGFHLIDAESLRRHYAKTLIHWADNFENAMEDIVRLKDEAFIRMWRLYLNACSASFSAGNIDVHQFLFSKGPADDIPWTRDYLYR